MLLAPATSGPVFKHSSPTAGSGVLADGDAMGIATWRASIATLWNATMDDTALTYFLTTHNKTSLCNFDPNVNELLIFL
jgi:hypothetical protein